MDKSRWKVERFCKGLDKWLNDPERVKYMLDDPRRAILGYVDGKASLGSAEMACMILGTRYECAGVARVWSGDLAGLEDMQHGMRLKALHYHILRIIWGVQHKGLHLNLHKVALSLGLAATVGASTDASWLYGACADLRFNEFAYPIPNMKAANFVVQIYAAGHSLPQPAGYEIEEPFATLFNSWDHPDSAVLTEPIMSVCDYHIAQTGQLSNRTPEFNETIYQVMPVEVLMVYRLREARGLENPDVDHPVMRSPFGRLYPVREVEPLPLLAKVRARAATFSGWANEPHDRTG